MTFKVKIIKNIYQKMEQKSKTAILEKLGIKTLNEMQKQADEAIGSNDSVVLLSPTGTGKTLAFLLPVLETLNASLNKVQVLILVPSRELALQIESVVREMGTGIKANAVYGGRAGSIDRIELKQNPAILIGTPGRIADHFNKETFELTNINTLVLDEFDKSLEIGFENEMKAIIESLPNLKKRILTSATQKVKIPEFVGIVKHRKLDFLKEKIVKLKVKTISSDKLTKLETLRQLISQIGPSNAIIFCNRKESISRVSNYLNKTSINHACFHGGLEQLERERALIKFRNGTARLLLATDLAARGIDIPELDCIIHYEIPPRPDEFIHRNGRTARMGSNGVAYIIKQTVYFLNKAKLKKKNWA